MRISDWSSDVCSSDLEVHPDDGARLGLTDGGLARVETPQGDSLYRVAFHAGQRPGELFVPIHWTDRTSSGGRTGLLPRPLVDPVSGQPGFKRTPASVAAVTPKWRGFLLIARSEEHTSELQSLMRISYAVFCLKKKNNKRKYQ